MDAKKRDQIREFLLAATALLDSMEASVRNDGDDVWKYNSYKVYARKYMQLVRAIVPVVPIDTIVDAFDADKLPGNCDTIAAQQKSYYDVVHANLLIVKSYLENKLGMKADERENIKNFLKASLRKAVFDTPAREVDVQNCVEQLLVGRGMGKGIDYDRETGRVKVSIKESIPDFIFPKLGLALEIKLSKDREKSREIVDEINADIRSYSTKYQLLLFLVYDIGSIRDEAEFAHGLDNADNISVIVVKH